ncbi:YjjW family glycine radical enzyme activase (plasmid) [Chloroflexota bacterium]|nr:YjjW family glycine radical enzyme activase [Chloroflexota bacterium]
MTKRVMGRINNILPQSFVDGPGNRSVVFLQGCQFNCLYCHNPYTINYCNACGTCVESCPVGALRLDDGEVLWDAVKCVQCDTCIDICPNSSSPKVLNQTPQATWKALQAFVPFISGVTVTGGEPGCQPEYLAELLRLIKSQSDLTTCIETNGGVGPEVIETLLPYLDYVMVDLKAFDPEVHLALTGQDNARTLETIKMVAEAGKFHMVRTVVAPGYTDDEAQIIEIAGFLASLNPEIHLRLLRFRPHGTHGIASSWESPTDVVMDHLIEMAKSTGLVNVDRSL